MIQQLDRLFHMKDVERFSGLDHSTLYRRIKAGSFPLSGRADASATGFDAWRRAQCLEHGAMRLATSGRVVATQIRLDLRTGR